jgi:hypothetical protein
MSNSKPMPLPQPCLHLPREAREVLISSTRVADPHARRVAVDAAIDYVKLRFPMCFQPTPQL